MKSFRSLPFIALFSVFLILAQGKALSMNPDCFHYQYDYVKRTATVTGLSCNVDLVFIPDTTILLSGPNRGDYAVVAIGDSAFYNSTIQNKLHIPSTVTFIGKSAFEGCTGLRSVTMDSICSIGEYAFKGCSGLKDFYSYNPEPPACAPNVFEGVNDCNLFVPFGCTQKYKGAEGWNIFPSVGEKGYTIIDSIKYRTLDGERAEVVPHFIYRRGGLKHLTFQSSVTIDKRIFRVTQIGEDAFRNSGYVYKITIPGCIDTIGPYAFWRCAEDTLVIENGVKRIGDGAFGWGERLKSLSLPESVTSIGNEAFTHSEIDSVFFKEGLESIGDLAFASCGRLAAVSLPDGIKNIGKECFRGCYFISSVTIGEGLTIIPEKMFSSCSSIARVYLPESVQEINDKAFYYCRDLREITCMNPVPPSLGSGVFDGLNFLPECKLIVPEGSEDAYRSAEGWKEFWLDGTDIGNSELPDISIKRYESGFVIGGAAYGEEICVYDEGGMLLQNVTVTDEYTEIALKECGIYIIRYRGKGIKVVL